MRLVFAAAVIALLATPASLVTPTFAQDSHVPRYGEPDKDKTPAQIQADKDADRAYKKSLNNIPDKGPSDPWGAVRSDTPKTASAPATKTATKTKTKTGAAN